MALLKMVKDMISSIPPHRATHASGGTDALTPEDLGIARTRVYNGILQYYDEGTWKDVGGGIVSVQRGITYASEEEKSVVVAISSVDVSKSFVTSSVTGARYIDGSGDTATAWVRITSPTTLEVYNNTVLDSGLARVAWEVVQFA